MKTTEVIFQESYDLLKESEWIQGTMHEPMVDLNGDRIGPDGYCMVGAVRKSIFDKANFLSFVTKRDTEEWFLYEQSLAKLERVIGQRSPTGWNDEEGRTKDEVLEVLKEAQALPDIPEDEVTYIE